MLYTGPSNRTILRCSAYPCWSVVGEEHGGNDTMTPPSWHTLALPTFALRFQYPDTTPDGHPVEMDEVRLHVRSAGSTEVYFEVSRHLHVSAHDWYAHEARGLRARFADVRVTPLQASTVAEQPASPSRFAGLRDNGRRCSLSRIRRCTASSMIHARPTISSCWRPLRSCSVVPPMGSRRCTSVHPAPLATRRPHHCTPCSLGLVVPAALRAGILVCAASPI
jgi:hypothetical protein